MITQLASLVRVDFAPRHRQPSAGRLVLATIASIAGSLAADALLVVIGEAVFPATKGFVHFQFSDYAKLTVAGVIIACVAWPIVTRISSAPRWLFFRLAILVTLVLWLPDIWILHKGESADAVAVLMVMHLAIAVVTYNLLVHVAPVRPLARGQGAGGRDAGGHGASGRGAVGQDAGVAADPAARGQHRHAR
jgi:bacteriorhodopsin